MSLILRMKWFWVIFWVTLAVALSATMPSLDRLVKEKNQPTIAKTYKSAIASDLQKELNKGKRNGKNLDAILVIHKNNPFTKTDLERIKKQLEQIKQKPSLQMNGMLTPFEHKEAEQRMLAKDRKTLMAVATVTKTNENSVKEVRDRLKSELDRNGWTNYITGDAFIADDYAQTSIDGVKKTELFAVVFIIAVLVIVFRSPVSPLISLVIVGISYLVSIGVVANLVEYLGFPFANTTQIFLVLVLFGIGTDYNILLFMRFKEELPAQETIKEAILVTYRTAGKTVFFSGLAVLIGFSMLAFSNFSIYQSGVAVAVGVVILLAVLFMVVPFCMAIFGELLFWPSKQVQEHKENKLWYTLGRFSVNRSLFSLVLIVVVSVPFLFLYQGKLSFDSLQEIHPDYESVKGFQLVAVAFGAGQTLPTEVLLKDKQAMDSPEGLGFIDDLQQKLEQIPGVKSVYGPTRPNGKRIDQLYTKEQTKQVNQGLDQSTKGIDQISGGLDQASGQIKSSTTGDLANVGKLVNGTETIRQGLGKVGQALTKIQVGMGQGADGADRLATAIKQLDQGMGQLNQATTPILQGYRLLASQLGKAEGQLSQQIKQQSAALDQAADQIIASADQLAEKNPQLAQDEDLEAIRATANQLKQKAASPTIGGDFSQAVAQLNRANEGLAQVVAGQKKLQSGSQTLSHGAEQLADGLKKGAAGQAKVVRSINQIDQGLSAVNNGQKLLSKGLQSFAAGMKQLQQGLDKSSNGLGKISSGITKGNDYLAELTGNQSLERFYVPADVKQSKDFQQALDMYMSADRRVAKYNVVLSVDPYSQKAMEIAREIDRTVKETATYTAYRDMKIGTGGISATNDDLSQISASDFSRTVTFMLIGIGIMLVVLFRSFWLPVLIMLSLISSYYTSLSLSELIFSQVWGERGLSWTVPFFSFILIVALGVDYSIFLLMRYQESVRESPSAAILLSMRRVGGVVISAAIILCGTFAAMYPSGVITLMQISTVVIMALLLLTFLLLPIFIPAGIALLEKQGLREQQRREQLGL